MPLAVTVVYVQVDGLDKIAALILMNVQVPAGLGYHCVTMEALVQIHLVHTIVCVFLDIQVLYVHAVIMLSNNKIS